MRDEDEVRLQRLHVDRSVWNDLEDITEVKVLEQRIEENPQPIDLGEPACVS